MAASMVRTLPVGAEALKITPLSYQAKLAKDEIKKGYVDISNPQYQTVEVALSVQAFRQIDDDGSLEFYADEKVARGVLLDLDEVTLKSREAIRVYFLLDSSKLPSGDVFAAIFASTKPSDGGGTQQSVRVGTLLMLTNGEADHTADIAYINAPWLQVGEGLRATLGIRNPADQASSTGFSPTVIVQAQPYSETTVEGPLVFAGRTRTVDYVNNGNFFGPIRLTASAEGAATSRWVFAVTGYWTLLAPTLLFLIVAAVSWWVLRRLKHATKFRN